MKGNRNPRLALKNPVLCTLPCKRLFSDNVEPGGCHFHAGCFLLLFFFCNCWFKHYCFELFQPSLGSFFFNCNARSLHAIFMRTLPEYKPVEQNVQHHAVVRPGGGTMSPSENHLGVRAMIAKVSAAWAHHENYISDSLLLIDMLNWVTSWL